MIRAVTKHVSDLLILGAGRIKTEIEDSSVLYCCNQ